MLKVWTQLDKALQYQETFWPGQSWALREEIITQIRTADALRGNKSNLQTKIDPETGDIISYFSIPSQKETTQN